MKRALIADDYEDILDSLVLRFQHAGWDVTGASDGLEALTIFNDAVERGEYFDLLILDVVMPRLNGIEVGINIRRREKVGDIPRAVHVYLTGYDEDLTIHGNDLKKIDFADEYFQKPIDINELIEKVTKLVETR